ncbi:MAG: tRNA uridine(34) 5-carboxymethylaminomethyl modification radical SAM/GNAT enzyme Elp3 [Candidatus Bathyarchaeia archaeon]
MSFKDAVREIIEALMGAPASALSREYVNRVKIRVAAKYGLGKIPSNAELIAALHGEEKRRLLPVLRRKTTRTVSGVTVVAVMTSPFPCPQPEPCAYCPGGPPYGVPQSYTGFEPAAMRGLQNKFDPYLQVRSRIEQLLAIGHEVDKIELIVMGGTFPATPDDYQVWFVKRCLDAVTGLEAQSLDEAKRFAEASRIRNVGITVETRPDWAKEGHVDKMLDMGVTRVELGVQHPNDEIYCLVGRRHSVRDVVEATRILKDAGLKVVYHMMPGLPGSNMEKDLAVFREVFSNPNFKPDMIKIYPCLVLKGTKAYEWYVRGEYRPYTTEEAARLIVEVKKLVPPWVRIMRVQRDIPAQLIVAGVKMSNLRQLVQQKLRAEGLRCRCIRCREVGHRIMADGVKPNPENIEISIMKYAASEGEEIFISAEDKANDVLVGYLRLRIPSAKAHRPEIRETSCSIVRELHVYGPLVPVGKHLAKAWQHKGYGGILLSEAERITKEEYDLKKILVISALGTKQYYKRFGYEYDGVYMSKILG